MDWAENLCFNFLANKNTMHPLATLCRNYQSWYKGNIFFFILQELWGRKELKLISKAQVIVRHPDWIMYSTSFFPLMF